MNKKRKVFNTLDKRMDGEAKKHAKGNLKVNDFKKNIKK